MYTQNCCSSKWSTPYRHRKNNNHASNWFESFMCVCLLLHIFIHTHGTKLQIIQIHCVNPYRFEATCLCHTSSHLVFFCCWYPKAHKWYATLQLEGYSVMWMNVLQMWNRRKSNALNNCRRIYQNYYKAMGNAFMYELAESM